MEVRKDTEVNFNNKSSTLATLTKSIYPDYITPPSDTMLLLSDVVISSSFASNSLTLTDDILREFNSLVPPDKSCFVPDIVRGQRILPGKLLLGLRNNVPELHGPSAMPIADRILVQPGKFTKIIGIVNQMDLFYGKNGSYILNVPKGHFAKALLGQKPVFYNEGTHVIHDSTLKFDERDGIISQSSFHIKHQTINILRIPAGHLAKILLDGIPYILSGRKEHYVFDSANFNLVDIVQELERYIQHENIHILRIPSGMLAKIYIGSEAKLLEPQAEPYIFNTPLFKLITQGKDLFFDATEQITRHGAIKRIIPHTGQVAVTYDSGKLRIYYPSGDGKPIMITSPTHEVIHLLNVGVETLVFPSEETKKRRMEENPDASTDEIAYEIFTTSDSLKVGVKLLVAFEIIDPQIALTNLINYQGILTHIENCATVDMGKAIQRSTATEFTSTYHNQPKTIEMKEHEARFDPNFTGNPILHFQDEVKKELGKDLKEFGIKLIRLNVETPKIIDTNIQKAMEEQSIISAKVNTEAANLEKRFLNAKRQAEQKAEKNRIAVKQKNDAIKSKAEAQVSAARARAEAEVIEAEAKGRALLIAAKNEADAMLLKADAERKSKEMLGSVYEKNPKLVELEIKKLESSAIAKFQGTLITPNMNAWPSGIMAGSPFSLFSSHIPSNLNSQNISNLAEQDKVVVSSNSNK